MQDGVLVGIEVDIQVENPVPNDVLGKCFYYEDGMYKAKSNIPILNSVAALLLYLIDSFSLFHLSECPGNAHKSPGLCGSCRRVFFHKHSHTMAYIWKIFREDI